MGEARRRQSEAHSDMSRKRADWSRPLPRRLVIPTVMTLKTLADVRELMRHLPAEHPGAADLAVALRPLAAAPERKIVR